MNIKSNMFETDSPFCRAMTRDEAYELHPWWENNTTIISLILGLPVVGLVAIGVLSLVGINSSDFPYMFSTEFFVTDLSLRLLTLPIGVLLIRAFLKWINTE